MKEVKKIQEFLSNGSKSISDDEMLLFAPNGARSKLTPQQYLLVRTPAFIAWFGDWLNSPATASKVVDENGEPMVVWHWSRTRTSKRFNEFRVDKQLGAHFGTLELVKLISKRAIKDSPKLYSVFLNFKKPIRAKDIGYWSGSSLADLLSEKYPKLTNKCQLIHDIESDSDFELATEKAKELAIKNGIDGIVYLNRYETKFLHTEEEIESLTDEEFKSVDKSASDSWIAFEPSQIKLADGTNTTFDGGNPDIRFEEGGAIAQNSSFEKIMTLPNLYDQRSAMIRHSVRFSTNPVKFIVAFSGGKDSIAMVLHLLELGVPKSQIELWHHDVDGHGEELFDWKVTPEYCKAFADAMGITLLFSYREGGIVKRLLRNNEPRGNVWYQTPDFQWHMIESDQTALNTGGRFPSVSADLQSRWCSSEVKIDVASTILANDPRLQGTAEEPVEIIFCTGERHDESTKRATYEELQVYKRGRFTQKRKVLAWRPIIEYKESDVWELLQKWNIQPHPCYFIGWSRCSCQLCIFNGPDYWQTALIISTQKVIRIRELEIETASFEVNAGKEHTLYNKKDIFDKCSEGTAVVDTEDDKMKFWIRQATEKFTMPIFVEGEWILPIGAFKTENCGAS